MRTIKFRVWHRFKKKMYRHVCDLKFSNWNGVEHHLVSIFARNDDSDAVLDETKNWELMQFTGLKDKNGVEIFEGDVIIYHIVGHKAPHKAVIEFKDGKFVENLYGWILYPAGKEFMMEVIGNVFSNPELLKGEGAE